MGEKDWLECISPTPMLDGLSGKASERKLRLFAVVCCHRIWDRVSDEEVVRAHRFLIVQCGAEDSSDLIPPDCGRRAIELAEQFADRKASDAELSAVNEAVSQLTFASEYYAATKPTGIGDGDTDYALMATGRAACAAQDASSYIERLRWAAHNAAEAIAYLRCGPDDPLPEPELDSEEQIQQSTLLRDIFGNPFRPVTLDPRWLTSNVVDLAQAIDQERAFDRMPILADALMDAGCDSEENILHCRGEGPHVRGCWVVDLLLGKA